jgi:hypothetical protein
MPMSMGMAMAISARMIAVMVLMSFIVVSTPYFLLPIQATKPTKAINAMIITVIQIISVIMFSP